MLSYYVIYCEKFRKVLQRTEKVALIMCIDCLMSLVWTTKHMFQCAIQVKATFSVHKLIKKNTHMTTLYTNWYITFTKIYYIRHEKYYKSFSSLSYIRRISGVFVANAM